MKPIILYAMPRSRGSVTMSLSKCENKILNITEQIHGDERIFPIIDNYLSFDDWKVLESSFNRSNTIVRLFPYELYQSKRLINWFLECQIKQTHEIFVMHREDTIELAFSLVLAKRFGWNKINEIDPFEFEVNYDDIANVVFNIDCYLRYFPKIGKILDFKNLPNEYFNDIQTASLQNQKSYTKYKFIKNFLWCKDNLEKVNNFFQDDIDLKLNSLSFKK